jgi:hypothetical protein
MHYNRDMMQWTALFWVIMQRIVDLPLLRDGSLKSRICLMQWTRLTMSSASREIKCRRFWPCRKIFGITRFLDIIDLLCLKRNLKHCVFWTGRSVFDFVLSMNDVQTTIREWLPFMQKGFCCVDMEWKGGRNVTVERLSVFVLLRHNTERY